jgi:hypothetical protein
MICFFAVCMMPIPWNLKYLKKCTWRDQKDKTRCLCVLTHLTEHYRWNNKGCGQEDSLEESFCTR